MVILQWVSDHLEIIRNEKADATIKDIIHKRRKGTDTRVQ